MSYIALNGIEFDANIAISEYKRKLNILQGPNAGRVMSGDMVLDPLGAYLGREITVFRRGNNYAGLDAFWDFLVQNSMNQNGVYLEAADGQSTIAYQAYYGDTEQSLVRVQAGINYWGDITVSFVPMSAQVKP